MSFKLYITISCCLILSGQFLFSKVVAEAEGHVGPEKVDINYSNVTISYGSQCCENNDKYKGYTTTGKTLYPNRFPASSIKCFSYRVKVQNHTHIGLFSNNNVPQTNPWVEIVIGGFPDGLTNIFRKNDAEIASTKNQKQNSLNCGEYRGFWVSWVSGNYRVGYRGQPPFITWQDPNPFAIVSVGVDTCSGTIGRVIQEEPKCPGINM